MIAAGCLVQWYEIDMFEEYLDSLIKSIGEQKDKVMIDMCLVTNQDLEKCSDETDIHYNIEKKFVQIMDEHKLKGYLLNYKVTDNLYTIADYRRDFNEKYCEIVDVLFWGESDMLVPSQAMESIISLHEAVKDQTPKGRTLRTIINNCRQKPAKKTS